MTDSKKKEILIAAAAGGLIGLIGAVLMTPQAGEKTRSDLADLYERGGRIASKAKNYLYHPEPDDRCYWTEKAKSLICDLTKCVKGKHAEDIETNHHTELAGAVAGVVIGALAGLLLAPKAGEKLREDLSDRYHDLTDRAEDIASSLSKRGRAFAKSARATKKDWLETASDLIDHFSEEKEHLSESITDKVKDLADMGHEKFSQVLGWVDLGMRLLNKVKKKR